MAAAERGWPVFPLRAGHKTPALHGVHRCPRCGECADGHKGWEQRATTDHDQITAWWQARPCSNVAIACGRAGLVVLDLDVGKATDIPGGDPNTPRHGGQTLRRLAAAAGHPDIGTDTRTVVTPSQGAHLYYLAPPGAHIRNTVGGCGSKGLGPLLDVRAAGGYIVAAGSVLHAPTGERAYRLHPERPTDPAPLPEWLATALTQPATTPALAGHTVVDVRHHDAYVRAAVTGEAHAIRTAASGTRAFTLFKSAAHLGELVGAGLLTVRAAHDALSTAAAVHNGIDGWNAHEAEHHITNGLAAGHTQPRRHPTPAARRR